MSIKLSVTMCARLAGVAVLASISVLGQVDSRPAFDVASVKLSRPGERGPVAPRLAMEPGGQRFTATNATVKSLIVMAYNVTPRQVSGGPSWLDSDGFDIDAKTDVPASRDRMRLMLRTLLSERFFLTLHREPKILPVAALVVIREASGLHPAADAEAEPKISFRGAGNRSVSVTAQNVTMPFLAEYLSGRLQQIVVDRTGNDGRFDFAVELTDDPEVSERDSMSYMFYELVKKIGLKLQADKVPVDFISIEHAEKPLNN